MYSNLLTRGWRGLVEVDISWLYAITWHRVTCHVSCRAAPACWWLVTDPWPSAAEDIWTLDNSTGTVCTVLARAFFMRLVAAGTGHCLRTGCRYIFNVIVTLCNIIVMLRLMVCVLGSWAQIARPSQVSLFYCKLLLDYNSPIIRL